MDDQQLEKLNKAWKELCNALKTEKPTSYVYKFIIYLLDWLNDKLNK